MAEHDPLLETTADLGPEAPSATPEELLAFQASARLLANASPLSRAYCPSPQELIATDKALGGEKADRRQNHIAACPLCRDDLADYRALQVIPEPALSALKGKIVLGLRAAKEAVAQALELIETTLTPVAGNPVAVRGAAEAVAPVVLQVPFGEGELELTWQGDAEGIDLQVRAIGRAPIAYRLALAPRAEDEGWSAGVWENRTADDSGRASVGGLAAGEYVLTVYGPQRRQPDVEVELTLDLG